MQGDKQQQKALLDSFVSYGHENVLGTHPTTLEFTTEPDLTKRGNCILGVRASKACSDLNEKCRAALKKSQKIEIEIQTESDIDSFIGYGHPDLSLSNPVSIVFRKSEFVSDRTGLINCSKVAKDIDRSIIEYLKDPKHSVEIRVYLII